jgi:hypothetical protein
MFISTENIVTGCGPTHATDEMALAVNIHRQRRAIVEIET